MRHWCWDSIFYHIYPLGLCGAPPANDFSTTPEPRLEALHPWIAQMRELGANALYLGPVFESATHGYDTTDYFRVDRRLGTEDTLAALVSDLRRAGIRVVLDCVFNHVGRKFRAFQDVIAHKEHSGYRDWFHGLRFKGQSPFGDPFVYEGWNGHLDLVKLNLGNPGVKQHLFQAAEMWIRRFDIDGLRLDAAECMDLAFLQELSAFCKTLKPDFWLMGEVVGGDYRRWLNEGGLDSVTNYEAYKGLYSSHVDKNYFEIAYSLNREFGPEGIYAGKPLYSFADNHDVNRVASLLTHKAHVYTLYCLLFAMPGIPSVYYGSEFGLEGRRRTDSDEPLRPQLDLPALRRHPPEPGLAEAISRLAAIRSSSKALRFGDYLQLAVKHEQFAFSRSAEGEHVVVAVNAAEERATLEMAIPFAENGRMTDLLNTGESFEIRKGKLLVDSIWPRWGRILKLD